jgi:NodT family efflux transporter outer membrane factor (OMF) lipoprotein
MGQADADCRAARFAWARRALRLSRARPLAAGAIAFSLGGCVVGPDFSSPAPPPVADYLPAKPATIGQSGANSRTARGADLPGAWWELLGSRNLSALVEAALTNNADIEAAEAAVRVAHANLAAGAGAFWPTAQAKWDSSRQLTPTRTLASNHATDKASYTLHTPQVSVTYALDVWGGTKRQVEALDALVEVADFQREAAILTLTSSLALAAIQQASFEGQIAATRRLIEVQTQLLEVLRRQQTAGQIALPDVLAQETAAAQAKLLLPPLERQRDQARNLMAALSGRFPSEMGRETFRLSGFKVPRQVPVSVPADLVHQRPDVRVAEATLRQANALIGAAIAARYPQITLTGNGGSTADAIGKLFSPGTWFYMIAGSAVHTIFDGRTLAMKQRAAEETFNQTSAQYRSVVLVAFQNVADALVAIEADGRAITAAIEAEKAAQRSLDIVRQQVDQGQVSLPALLTAQQAYLQTSLARVQAEASRFASIVALFQALGGGWWNRPTTVDVIAEVRAAPWPRTTARQVRTVNVEHP